jgi:hypothetical protein
MTTTTEQFDSLGKPDATGERARLAATGSLPPSAVDTALVTDQQPPTLREFDADEVLGKPRDNRALVSLARAAARLGS